jgi:hypothetical protein
VGIFHLPQHGSLTGFSEDDDEHRTSERRISRTYSNITYAIQISFIFIPNQFIFIALATRNEIGSVYRKVQYNRVVLLHKWMLKYLWDP